MSRPVRCLNCGQMSSQHAYPSFHCPDHANKGKFLADQRFTSDIGTPILKRLCEALGWQGGTIHEALAEVRRLVEVKKSALFYTNDWTVANHNDPEIARLAVERLANLHDLLVLKSRA